MKTIFDGLISRLDTVEEKISDFKNMSTELSKLKCKEEKEQKKIKENKIPKSCKIISICIIKILKLKQIEKGVKNYLS